MTNETEQLRRLVDAREKATKGDWQLQVTKFRDGIKSLEIITPDYDVVSAVVRHPIRSLEDAKLIALSGTIDLRAILTRVEKMEAALRWYADEGNWQKDPNDVEVLHERKAGGIAKEALE